MPSKKNNWVYSEKVKDHFFSPRNILKIPEEKYKADGVGYTGSPKCGDVMKMFIKVKNGRIIDCKWQTFGCASAISSTSVLSEMVTKGKGMKLEDAMKIKPQDIVKELNGLPNAKIHCSVLGDKALREAINDYYKKSGQDKKIKKEKTTVVCTCLNITDHDIEEAVLEGKDTYKKVQQATKVGTVCGACEEKVTKLIEMYKDKHFKS